MKKVLCVICLIILPVNLFGADIDSITVLEFNTNGVSESEMLIFIDYIASEITRNDNYILIDRRQRDKILDELAFSNSGCTDESCQLEIGSLISANFIIVGSIGSLGSSYILNMQLVAVETGETTETISKKYGDLDELVNDSRNLMTSLLSSNSTVTTAPETELSIAPTPPVTNTTTSRTAPLAPISIRKTLFSTQYTYKGKLYDGFNSKNLANIIMTVIPHTSENAALFNSYQDQRNRGGKLIGTGMALTGVGLLVEVMGGVSKNDEILIGGAVGAGIGLVINIIGGRTLSAAHKTFGELVAIYNRQTF